jgi:hypothetical protein
MNFIEAYAEIAKFFDTEWATATSVSYPDKDFTIPEGENWVRFNCQETSGNQVSMGSPGNNRFRHFGLVTIQVFQPQGLGSKEARQLATTALGVFMGATTTNGVKFFDVAGNQVGNDGKGFFQINVVASFYYDQLT